MPFVPLINLNLVYLDEIQILNREKAPKTEC